MEALQYSECQSLFDLSRVDPAFLLTALRSGSNLGSISFADLGGPDSSGNIKNAITTPILGTRTVTLPDGRTVVQSTFTGANIVLNNNAASLFSTGTDIRRAITLIHELGHVANMIFGPGSSTIADNDDDPALSRQNSQSVRNHCF